MKSPLWADTNVNFEYALIRFNTFYNEVFELEWKQNKRKPNSALLGSLYNGFIWYHYLQVTFYGYVVPSKGEVWNLQSKMRFWKTVWTALENMHFVPNQIHRNS